MLWGDKLWMTTAIEQNLRQTRIGPDEMYMVDHLTLLAVCVDRSSGKILWQTEIFSLDKPAGVHLLNSFATPTPVVEPGRLYCDFGAYGTACVDSETGKILWKEQLVIDHQVGPGSSPDPGSGLAGVGARRPRPAVRGGVGQEDRQDGMEDGPAAGRGRSGRPEEVVLHAAGGPNCRAIANDRAGSALDDFLRSADR